MNDPYNLERFIEAQNRKFDGFEKAHSDLLNGRKQGHWIWYIFPQMKGLGTSGNSTYFGISSLDEARAYLEHSILGPRLRECSRLVLDSRYKSIDQILGGDDIKFRSSMTLFSRATSDNEIFKNCLEKYYGGELDQRTLQLL